MKRLRQKLFFTASLPRTLLEVGALAALLFAILPSSAAHPSPDGPPPEILFLMIICGFWAAVRLCWRARFRVEWGVMFAVGVAVCLGILPIILFFDKQLIISESESGLGELVFIFLLNSFIYINFRITFVLLRRWNGMRKKRLLWSFTHTQIIIILIVAGVIILVTAIGTIFQINEQGQLEQIEDVGMYILNVVVEVLPLFATMAISIVFLAFIFAIPLVFVSYLLTRGTIGRLEDLAKGTAELRAGDLTTRVTVSGEDEVAQLQEDFNQMAADLENSVAELEQERDRVAGLLRVQQELTAAVSHELRTPIATIQGYLQPALARMSATDDPAMQNDLEIIAGETERLRKLIDDLFALSRAEVEQLTMNIQPTDVTEIAQRIVDIWQPLSWQQQKVDVVHQSETGSYIAFVDGNRLEQILTNLVHNATRHTPPGGIVVLAVCSDNVWVTIEVRDTGEGIAAEALPFIWEPFYRGEENGRSADGQTGLGLALVKTMTEAMGGQVHVTSQLGEGSCFQIRLPKA